jgi:DNA-directed RNA polymerase subunit alpha
LNIIQDNKKGNPMIETNKFNVKTVKSEERYGKFELSPLVGGFGHTLGNSLRRVY